MHLRNMWTCIVATWDNLFDEKPKFDVQEFKRKDDAVEHAIEAMGVCCDRGRARYGLRDHSEHTTQKFGSCEIIVARLFEGALSKSELVAVYPDMKWNVGYHDC